MYGKKKKIKDFPHTISVEKYIKYSKKVLINFSKLEADLNGYFINQISVISWKIISYDKIKTKKFRGRIGF